MSTYTISKSSLLSLKAEILRKQDEVNKVKLQNKSKVITEPKKGTPLDLKNKGINQRQLNDVSEDDDLLKKSRSVLEAKAALYEQLSKGVGKDNEENARFLVQFNRKYGFHSDESDREESDEERHFSDEYEPATNPGDEWVEYVDCLGRTRKCLRKDLDYIKEKDSELKSTINAQKEGKVEEKKEEKEKEVEKPDVEFNETSELLSGDMRRELLRKKWEEEEEKLKNKSDIHYQDVLFDEARIHGVGYYSFSKNVDERVRQQEALKQLRKETEQEQKKSEELRTMRDKQLAARAKAARNRKRARMGLPPEEDEPEELPKNKEEEAITEKKEAEDKEEKEKERLRQKHVRPWDIGKKGVKEHEYTQEDWVQKKRKERIDDFAPPSSYSKSDKNLYFSTKKDKDEINVDVTRPPPKINNPSKRSSNPYRTKETKDLKQSSKDMGSTPIVDECVDFDEEEDRLLKDYRKSDFEENKRGKGAEIAPPPTFEYYGPSGSKKAKTHVKASSLEESITAGLQFLRQQSEKKGKSTKRPMDMFIM